MSNKSSTGIYSYSKFPFILNNHAVLFFFLELSNNYRDLSHFVNRLPVATESKNKIYKILMNIIRNPSTTKKKELNFMKYINKFENYLIKFSGSLRNNEKKLTIYKSRLMLYKFPRTKFY